MKLTTIRTARRRALGPLLALTGSVFALALAPAGCNYELHTDYESATESDSDTDAMMTGTSGDAGETDDDATSTTEAETDSGVAPPEEFPPVTEPGPHGVGFRTIDVTYTPDAPFAEPRELEVAVWYPTADESGPPALYFDFVQRDDVFLLANPIPDTELPVLLFSHGNGGMAEQTFTLTEFFASHGWLVISPNHTGNTLIDIEEDRIPDMVVLRPQDVIASLEAVRALPAEDALANKVGEDIVMSGHSFGGYTTLALSGAEFDIDGLTAECELDPSGIACEKLQDDQFRARLAEGFVDDRIELALPLNPGAVALFGDQGLAAIDVPVLLTTAALDETTIEAEDGDPAWAGLDGADDRRLDYLTGGHFTLTYACAGELITGDGCGEGFIDPELAADVLNAYALGFARARLWGDESVRALLDGEQSLSDEVVLSLP